MTELGGEFGEHFARFEDALGTPCEKPGWPWAGIFNKSLSGVSQPLGDEGGEMSKKKKKKKSTPP